MYIDIKSIVDCLDGKKEDSIAQCRREIEDYVESQGSASLAIEEVGVRTHYPAPDSYLKVLWK